MGFDISCPNSRLNPTSVNGFMNFAMFQNLFSAAKIDIISQTAKFSGGFLVLNRNYRNYRNHYNNLIRDVNYKAIRQAEF